MQCKEAASKVSNAGHFANTVTCLPCRSLNKHGNQYSEARNKHVYKCSTYSHFKCHSVSDFNKVERVMTVRELPSIAMQYSSTDMYRLNLVIKSDFQYNSTIQNHEEIRLCL